MGYLLVRSTREERRAWMNHHDEFKPPQRRKRISFPSSDHFKVEWSI